MTDVDVSTASEGDDHLAPGDEPAPSVTGADLVVGKHRPGLDGLRAVAMTVMLAYHSQLPFARGAFLGLSQFFTLSGFLITGLLLRQRDRGGIGLKKFWGRRFRRLMPAALLCLAGIVVFGATVATRSQAEELPGQVTAAATYTANWYFIVTDKSYINLFADPSPVQHYWSLAVEEQFYLIMPLAMILIARKTRSPKVLATIFAGTAIASTAWMIYLYHAGAGLDRLYYGTDTRMAELAMGGLMAVVLYHIPAVSNRALQWMGGLGLAAFVLTAWGSATIPLADGPIWQGGYLVFSFVSCAVIAGIISERGPLSTVLSWGPLPAIGRLTYGLYLYHWPLFLWLTPERTGLDPWPLFALRMAVTFAVAIASYHLIEMPIRNGASFGLSSRTQLLVAPVSMVAIIALAFITVNRSAPDPLETLRVDDRSLETPIVPADGVLDVLVISDATGEPVVDRMEALAAADPEVSLTRTETFSCDRLQGPEGDQTCANWLETWPGLIETANPDLVLFYVEDWPADELAQLSGRPPVEAADVAAEALDAGFDLLTARGAPVLWAMPGTDFEGDIARGLRPFVIAMGQVEPQRDDLRRVLGGRLPDEGATPEAEFIDLSARTLLADASLYQRADRDRLPKVMVIGDSQSRSLGYGVERWAAEQDRAIVWNVATEGCGLAVEGTIRGFGEPAPIQPRCKEAVAALPGQIESFDPDLVLVLTSIWDVQDREHPSWDGFRVVGDPAVDAFLRTTYDDVLDTISAEGAAVVWLNAPCSEFVPVAGRVIELPDAFDPARSAALNREVLEPLADERDEIAGLFDLDGALCPGGEYTNTIDGVENIRVDGIHFSVDGALWFADKYGDELFEMGGL